ncbi:MAG: lycopene cyclase domain-containing protein, partial [Natronomonas sp.]
MRPDITVFGRFTYLLTEVVWGVVALVLLRRTNSVRKALRVCLL